MKSKKNDRLIRVTTREAKSKGKTDWARVDSLTDQQIEKAVQSDPDAAPLVDASFWDDAERLEPNEKVEVHMYLDKKVVDFFKQGGRGYQTRINSTLRTLVDQWYEKNPS